MRLTFDLVLEPTGDSYRRLLGVCAVLSDKALVVVLPNNALAPSAINVLDALGPHLIRKEKKTAWPGTTLLTGHVDVHLFRLNEAVLAILKKAAGSLYQWVQPDLPEDLCFLRADDSPVLVTIAHERDAYLEIDDEEARNLFMGIPGIELRRHESLQVLRSLVGGDRPDEHHLATLVRERHGLIEEAMATAQRTIALYPQGSISAAAMAWVCLRAGNAQEALSWYNRALALYPDSIDYVAGRGAALSRLGRHAEALQVFETVRAAVPNYFERVRDFEQWVEISREAIEPM